MCDTVQQRQSKFVVSGPLPTPPHAMQADELRQALMMAQRAATSAAEREATLVGKFRELELQLGQSQARVQQGKQLVARMRTYMSSSG